MRHSTRRSAPVYTHYATLAITLTLARYSATGYAHAHTRTRDGYAFGITLRDGLSLSRLEL